MRTVGVEEELLLVSAGSGRPRSVADRVLRGVAALRTGDDDERPGGILDHEFQQQQVETDSSPHEAMADLADDIRNWRRTTITAARAADARVIASGTSPLPVEPRLAHDARYERLADRFGIIAREQLICACHVHVSVASDEEAVAVLDRIRGWLPLLVALSANSPFWQGQDTGYASYRSLVMGRWPTAGPQEIFGSARNYHALVQTMLDSGVMLDHGMVYFDARLSHQYPTIEIRVADVCQDASDTVLLAALCRGLVDTAAREWEADVAPLPIPASVLRLASWQAARFGLQGDLIDPLTLLPRPAREVIASLVNHVRPALVAAGDEDLVDEQVRRVLDRGNGADRQRAVLRRTGQLADVVADLARVTSGQEG